MKTSDSHDLPPEAAPANAQPAAADAAAVPEGFIVMRMPANPFIDGIGPLYGRLEDDRFVMTMPPWQVPPGLQWRCPTCCC